MSSTRDRSHFHAPPARRALAALVAALTALGPGAAALAAPARTSIVALPYATLPGAPDDFAARVTAAVLSELKQRGELKVVEAPAGGETTSSTDKAKADADKARVAAAQLINRSDEQAKKGKPRLAAQSLQKAVTLLGAQPFALDEAGGKILSDSLLQLAINRAMAGDGDGSDAALEEMVRRAPDRTLAAVGFPPAFLRAFEADRQRVLSGGRGAIHVFAPAGAAEARVLLDGRPLGTAPLLLAEALAGEHAVRVESGSDVWAEAIKLEAGADISLLPRFGAAKGAADELMSALARGSIDRATATSAVKLAKAAGAQAALLGTVAHEGDGYAVRSALVLVRGEKVIPLAPLALDAEMLGASLEVLRLADDLVARLAAPPAGARLPLPMGGATTETASMPQVAAAPPPAETALSLPAASELAAAAGAQKKTTELPLPDAAPAKAPAADAGANAALAPPAPAAPAAPADTSETAAAAAAFTAAASGAAASNSAPAAPSTPVSADAAPGRTVLVPSRAGTTASAAKSSDKIPLEKSPAPAPTPAPSAAIAAPATPPQASAAAAPAVASPPAATAATAPAAATPAPATPARNATALAGSLDAAVAGIQGAPAASTPPTTAVSPAPAPTTSSASSEGRRVLLPGAAPIAPIPAAPPAPATAPATTASTTPATPPGAAPPADAAGANAAGAEATLATASRHPVEPATPSRDLFVPRRPTPRDEDDQPGAVVATAKAPPPAPTSATRIEPLEANQIATVHEEKSSSHAVLWIVAGSIAVGAAAAAGIVLYANSRTPTASNVTLSWSH